MSKPVATNEPCLPDSTLKRCTICGFIVDTQYAAELPPRNAAARRAQSETKEPSAKPAAAGDLERARALLADDPDEMDEEWLAGIITAIRAEARAEGATEMRERAAQTMEACPDFWYRPGGPPGSGYTPTTKKDRVAILRSLPTRQTDMWSPQTVISG